MCVLEFQEFQYSTFCNLKEFAIIRRININFSKLSVGTEFYYGPFGSL